MTDENQTPKQLTNSMNDQGYEETKSLTVILDDSQKLQVYDYSLSSVLNDPNVKSINWYYFII